jgi:hypothetical protein
MSYVIRNLGLAGRGPAEDDGYLLESYDPDAFGGRGYATWTADLAKAMRFATSVEAFELWRAKSTVRPVRPDGAPNRPLTAHTVEVITVEAASAEPVR